MQNQVEQASIGSATVNTPAYGIVQAVLSRIALQRHCRTSETNETKTAFIGKSPLALLELLNILPPIE